MKRALLAVAGVMLLGASLGSSCDVGGAPCACTLEFRFFTVYVRDGADQPVTDVALTRTNLRTGRVLAESGSFALLEPGTYIVADDSHVDEFSTDGDVVRVVGTKGNATFSTDFVFASPGPCRCHVTKISGPDTVTMTGTP